MGSPDPSSPASEKPVPSDALVFFGATGDLAYKKIFPSLQGMIRRGNSRVPVVGVAKSGWTIEQLRDRARASLKEHGGGVDEAAFGKLVALLQYIDGDYGDPATFAKLRRALGAAKHPAHYLAIPPSLFGTVIEQLGKSRLRGRRARRDREALRARPRLGPGAEPDPPLRLPREVRLPDRPLPRQGGGREPPRTSDSPTPFSSRSGTATTSTASRSRWPSSSACRGGASSTTRPARSATSSRTTCSRSWATSRWSRPISIDADRIRDEQVKVFRAIRPLRPPDVVRGQFDGYRKEPGVAPASTVETYAAVHLEVDSWRWAGVPFFIRAGKSLPLTATEVMVDLKRPPLSRLSPEESNYFRFRLGPKISLSIGARVKRPGTEPGSIPTELMAVRDAGRRRGGRLRAPPDRRHERRPDALRARGRGRGGLGGGERSARRRLPVYPYAPGTWGPAEANRLTAGLEGWHDPAPE